MNFNFLRALNSLIMFSSLYVKSLMGVLLYLSLATLARSVCNCVQCHISTHIIGSQTWCRCCYNAMSECANDCPNSVFTYDGCLQNLFEDRCLNTYLPTPQPVVFVPSPMPPTTSLLLPLQIRPCNCVGCQHLLRRHGAVVVLKRSKSRAMIHRQHWMKRASCPFLHKAAVRRKIIPTHVFEQLNKMRSNILPDFIIDLIYKHYFHICLKDLRKCMFFCEDESFVFAHGKIMSTMNSRVLSYPGFLNNERYITAFAELPEKYYFSSGYNHPFAYRILPM